MLSIKVFASSIEFSLGCSVGIETDLEPGAIIEACTFFIEIFAFNPPASMLLNSSDSNISDAEVKILSTETSVSSPLLRNPPDTAKSENKLFKPSVNSLPSFIAFAAMAEFITDMYKSSSDAFTRFSGFVISITDISESLPSNPKSSATSELALFTSLKLTLFFSSTDIAISDVRVLILVVTGVSNSNLPTTAFILKLLSRSTSSPNGISSQLGLMSQIILLTLGSAVTSTKIGPT